MISSMTLEDDDYTVILDINFELIKFKFKTEDQYNRFKSYIRLFSTEFESEVEIINDSDQQKKSLLKD